MNLLKESWLRWLTWLILAALFALACVFLSQWQFARRGEAVAKIDLVLQNYDKNPVALENLGLTEQGIREREWLPVSLSGEFQSEAAHLVRNRPLNGQPGFLQVIPFKLTSGGYVAVETGWLPTASDLGVPEQLPLPASGVQTITARIRPSEPELNRDAPEGQLGTISIQALANRTGLNFELENSYYLRLAKPYAESAPKILPKPELTEGNHLSYALQWILFALMGFAVVVWAVRQEINFKKMQSDPTFTPKRKKRRSDRDQEFEDSLS